MLELLITSILLFTGGYTTRWFTEPECKTIVHEVPIEYEEEIGIMDCKEEDGIICDINSPRWIIPGNEYSKLSGYIKGIRLHYMECDRLIHVYNEDKSN